MDSKISAIYILSAFFMAITMIIFRKLERVPREDTMFFSGFLFLAYFFIFSLIVLRHSPL